jgi:HSP20 family protein
VYMFDPNANILADTRAPESSDDKMTTAVSNDDNKVLASYRGANVYIEDGKDKYTISFDVPGVKIQDVSLQVKGSVLHVTAERKAAGKTIAKFAQHFALDETLVDPALLNASLSDGVLTISAPKKEEAAPQNITINSSDPTTTNEDGLFLTLDLPGIKAADMKIEYHKGTLSICGERTKTSPQGKRQVVSKVNRYFQLKEKLVDTSNIQAFLSDGVLTVVAPPKPSAPAKQIEIPTSSGKIEEDPSRNSTSVTEKTDSEQIVVETVTNDDEQ